MLRITKKRNLTLGSGGSGIARPVIKRANRLRHLAG